MIDEWSLRLGEIPTQRLMEFYRRAAEKSGNKGFVINSGHILDEWLPFENRAIPGVSSGVFGELPPQDYSLARWPDGSFKKLGRDRVTLLYPWGGEDAELDRMRENEEWDQVLEARWQAQRVAAGLPPRPVEMNALPPAREEASGE